MGYCAVDGAPSGWGRRVLLFLTVVACAVAAAAQHVETLLPTDDTYVHQGEAQATHGSETYLEVGSQRDANRRAFLKFDLAEISGSIDAASLHLFFYWGSGFTALRDDGVLIEVCAVDEDGWEQASLTWAAAPPVGEALASTEIGVSGRWIALDISEFVAAQAAGNEQVSVAVQFSHEDYDTTDRRIRFRSREHGDHDERPYLKVEYEPEEPGPPPRCRLTVNASPPEGGAVEVDGEEVSLPYEKEYDQTTTVELKAIPAAGRQFDRWEVDGVEMADADGLITVQVDAETEAIAHFVPLIHTITATAGAGGAIAPAGEVVVDHGEEQVFTIAPDEGQSIADVVVDGASVHSELVFLNGEATYTFAGAASDHTIHAAFASVPEVTVTDCLAVAPHPVSQEGCIFWLSLPEDAVAASLTVFAVDGAVLATIDLDPSWRRYPSAGRWKPQDSRGRLLGTGLYLCLVEVRHADGRVSYCPVEEVVISR